MHYSFQYVLVLHVICVILCHVNSYVNSNNRGFSLKSGSQVWSWQAETPEVFFKKMCKGTMHFKAKDWYLSRIVGQMFNNS